MRRLKNVYDITSGTNGSAGKLDDGEDAVTKRPPASCSRSGGSGAASGSGIDKSQCLSILSPFDEQEEWAKISEIMASFGSGLVRESVFVSELEKEFQNRLGECGRRSYLLVVSLPGECRHLLYRPGVPLSMLVWTPRVPLGRFFG